MIINQPCSKRSCYIKISTGQILKISRITNYNRDTREISKDMEMAYYWKKEQRTRVNQAEK